MSRACRASPGWRERITTEDLYDWDKMTSLSGRPGAAWGAWDGFGLPRHDPGLSGGRGGAPDQPASRWGLCSARRSRSRWPRTFISACGPRKIDRVADLIPPPRRLMRSPARIRRPETPGQISCRITRASTSRPPGRAAGAARRSRPPAARATPAAVAEIRTILANGGVAKRKRFMSEAGCRKALELQIEGPDLIAQARSGPLRPGLRPGAAA